MLAVSHVALASVRDFHIEDVINKISSPIFKNLGISDDSVSMYIIVDDSPNAFVMEGQNIFITTGLLADNSDAMAIAGVIAHEAGHIVGGHLIQRNISIKNMQMANILTLLSGAALGVASGSAEAGVAALQVGSDMGLRNFLSYSRAQESAADAVALRVLNNIGVETNSLVGFLKSLSSNEKLFYNEVPQYYSTHPVTSSRIEFLQHNSNPKEASVYSSSLKKDYEFASAKVLAFTSPIPDLLALYSGKDDEISKFILAIASFRQGKLHESTSLIKALNELAPDYKNELLGQIYYSFGNFKEAFLYYEKLYSGHKSFPTVIIQYVSTLMKLGKLQDAKNILAKEFLKNPSGPEVNALLAQIYSELGDKNMMHYHNCIYYGIIGDDRFASKHCNAIDKSKLGKSQLVIIE